jgi:hypothetical protein
VSSASARGAARCLGLRRGEDLRIEFFIEHGDFALRRGHQQLGRHTDEDAVVAGGVIAERVAQFLGHETRIAGRGEQMVKAGQELIAGGNAGGEARADARAERDEFLAPQFIQQARIAGEYDAQQGLRVEARAGEQSQLAQAHGRHFLGLVDQNDGSAAGGAEMIEPARAQRLEPAPAVADAYGDGEDVAEFAIEVAQVALRMVDDADGQIRQARETLSEQAHDHAFATARLAVDQRKAALAQVRLLDTPAEVLDLRRHVERLGRRRLPVGRGRGSARSNRTSTGLIRFRPSATGRNIRGMPSAG